LRGAQNGARGAYKGVNFLLVGENADINKFSIVNG